MYVTDIQPLATIVLFNNVLHLLFSLSSGTLNGSNTFQQKGYSQNLVHSLNFPMQTLQIPHSFAFGGFQKRVVALTHDIWMWDVMCFFFCHEELETLISFWKSLLTTIKPLYIGGIPWLWKHRYSEAERLSNNKALSAPSIEVTGSWGLIFLSMPVHRREKLMKARKIWGIPKIDGS